MKIFIIFILKIENSREMRKLSIYENLKILRAPYPLKELLLLILKNSCSIYLPYLYTFPI